MRVPPLHCLAALLAAAVLAGCGSSGVPTALAADAGGDDQAEVRGTVTALDPQAGVVIVDADDGTVTPPGAADRDVALHHDQATVVEQAGRPKAPEHLDRGYPSPPRSTSAPAARERTLAIRPSARGFQRRLSGVVVIHSTP